MHYICGNDIGDPYLLTFLGLCLICNNVILVLCNAWLVFLLMYFVAVVVVVVVVVVYLYLECVGFKTNCILDYT
jgi:hypothetical protein